MMECSRVLRCPCVTSCVSVAFVLAIVVCLKRNDVIEYFENSVGARRVVSVDEYGAKGDGTTDDTQAFKDAWETVCSMPSRPILKVPAPKVYLIGPIRFGGPCESTVTLMISGTIVAYKDPDFWDGLNPRKWLYFFGVDNLVVKGGGIVNGMGEEWWARSCKVNPKNPCRPAPTAITFHRCEYLNVRNLVIRDSQQVHLAFTNCLQVKVSNLKIFAHRDSPNTDGIHISHSTSVQVKNSFIGTGDDCISIVTNSSRIRIINVSCGPGHGISIGSLGKDNSSSEVHEVLVDGAFIADTENGLRIKTWQGGSGFVRDVSFRNVWMYNVSNPIIIDQYYCDSPVPCANLTSAVRVDRVSYSNIHGTSATPNAVKFACSDTHPCKRIVLKDIQLIYTGGESTAYCWNAFGYSSGQVYPLPCFPYGEQILQKNVLWATTILSTVKSYLML